MLPPRPALKAAAIALAPVIVVAAAGWLLVGPLAAIGIVLGVVAGSTSATVKLPWRDRVVACALCLAAAAGGLLAAAAPVPWSILCSVLVVAATGMLQAPLNRWSSGMIVQAPLLAAISATTGAVVSQPLVALGALAVGMVLVLVIAAVLGLQAPPTPAEPRIALRHAVATAVSCGVALGIALAFQIDHGYWLVVTLALVLRPVRHETVPTARARVTGTVVGVVISVALVIVMPTAAVLMLAMACILLSIAWGIAADVRGTTIFATPAVILIASSGAAGAVVEFGLLRLVLTVIGALVAALLAALLYRADAPAAPGGGESSPVQS